MGILAYAAVLALPAGRPRGQLQLLGGNAEVHRRRLFQLRANGHRKRLLQLPAALVIDCCSRCVRRWMLAHGCIEKNNKKNNIDNSES
jgi:transposase InsO family protein